MANIDSTLWANFMTGAYDKVAKYQLRSRPIWRQFVDVYPVEPTINQAPSYTINVAQEFGAGALTAGTTPLTDGSDPTAQAPPAPLQVTVNVAEYGVPSVMTLKVRDLSYVQVDPVRANLVGKLMYDSMDKLIQTVADSFTNILFKNGGVYKTTGGAEASVAGTDVIDSAGVRAAGSLLARRNVAGFGKQNPSDMSGLYIGAEAAETYFALAHPDVINDLLADANWLAPKQYVDPSGIYNREIGTYLGVRFIQGGANRLTVVADGVTSANVYRTYVLGAEAMLGATVEPPHLVVGPQVDSLRRNFPLGFYALLGFTKFRNESIQVVRTSSSIAAL